MLELFVCSHLEFISFQPALAGTGHVPMSAIARLPSDEDTGDEAQNGCDLQNEKRFFGQLILRRVAALRFCRWMRFDM